MKKVTSVVWKFFERIEDKGRCVGVVCKLCESEYKYFGNTTNLRVHLINKHPIQWELSENGALDEANITVEETSTPNTSTKKKKYGSRRTPVDNKNVGYSLTIDNEDVTTGEMPKIAIRRVEALQNSDSENDEATINLVRQMHGDQHSGEEWLEEDPYQITHIETYEPKPKRRKMKYQTIKREIPSPTGLPGFYVAPSPKSEPKIVYEDSRKDEYSIFGDYIANKLRKLKSPRTKGNIQQLISTILWQAEYGMYDNADAVKKVLMLTIQEPQEFGQFDNTAHNISEQIIEQSEQRSDEANQSTESLGIINS